MPSRGGLGRAEGSGPAGTNEGGERWSKRRGVGRASKRAAENSTALFA